MHKPEFANALKFIQDSQKGKNKISDYLEKVIEEVTKKKDEQFVLNLLIEGLSVDVIAEYTKLRPDRIKELREKFTVKGRLSPA